jgi:glycosyltransferase involved in cell wall biosynthesis
MTGRQMVLVLNHFAVPAGEPGGTRHTELFSTLRGWDHLIVAARTNYTTRQRQNDHAGFRFVPVTGYSSNGASRILNWGSYAVMAVLAGIRLIRHRPDVVYASSPHLLAGAAGALLAAVFRRPFVLEVRDLWPKVLVDMGQLSTTGALYKALAALESALYRRASRIVVLTPGVVTELTDRGVPADKLVLIPNAADPDYFQVAQDRESLRAKLGFTKVTVIYAGAHGPANGLDLALDAAAEIGDLPVEIVLIGDGISRDGLRERAQREGLRNVRFLEPVTKDQIPELLAGADVGLHCLADVPLFRYGVSPNKVFDYMAAGLPVLTNTPGEVGMLVEDADAGIGVQPTAIAAGIRQMVEAGCVGRERWGASGQAWITANQTRAAMGLRLQQLLDSVT